ncbi:MAG: bifunctional adenosylcobinamide kinase/adenosylcobinamide-phosphate guanylyltransferase [Oscillospiraceae bacterium]|nr:bifunctional adenosylcobinamide kinase/adenosylcobinamide-phosphate guanylyltransferase [Oscillospiraceae bacterium]
MVLILGGVGSGKRDYARSLGYTDDEMSRDVFSDAPVLIELEETVRRAPQKAEALLEPLCTKELVLCAEVGSGVIPLSAEDRRFREATGRLCVQLAKQAQSVVRIVSGIPTVIKGEMPCERC